MKKRKIKVLAAILVLACLVSAVSINISATGNFYNFDQRYTSVTNTNGYSESNFVYNPSINTIMYAETKSGSVSSFTGTLYMHIYDLVTLDQDATLSTDITQSPLLSNRFTISASNIGSGAFGVTEHSSISKTNSSDRWTGSYRAVWGNAVDGWSSSIKLS